LEDEDDFMLHAPAAQRLLKFLGSAPFAAFLTALDTDSGRVAERERHAAQMNDLKELLSMNGHRELHRWLGETNEFDDADFEHVKLPKLPMSSAAWVRLREVLIPEADDKDDGVPAIVNNLARYSLALHYKLDAVLEMCRAKESDDGSLARNWNYAVNKWPFLVDCDDHVRQTPDDTPLLLSRTSAVPHPPPTAPPRT